MTKILNSVLQQPIVGQGFLGPFKLYSDKWQCRCFSQLVRLTRNPFIEYQSKFGSNFLDLIRQGRLSEPCPILELSPGLVAWYNKEQYHWTLCLKLLTHNQKSFAVNLLYWKFRIYIGLHKIGQERK